MSAVPILFAVRGAKGIEADFYERLNVYLTTAAAIFAICLLVWLVLRIRTWFFESDDSTEPLMEILAQFRQLEREGELSEQEYRLISQRLAQQETKAGVVTTAKPRIPLISTPGSEKSTESSDP